MILTKTCKKCNGTGDWRGNYGKDKPDFRDKNNKCLHCNGKGYTTKNYNLCKYCGRPIEGEYACDSCRREFEMPRPQEDDE